MKTSILLLSILLCPWYVIAEYYPDEGDLARWSVRRALERCLRVPAENAEDKIEQLLKDLEHPRAYKHVRILQSLSKVGTNNKKVVYAIVKLLNTNNEEQVKIWGALALGDLGWKDQKVLLSLKKLANDKNMRVRRAVSMVLSELKAYDVILAFSNNKNSLFREVAARSFVNMGASAKKYITSIEKLSKDANVRVRREAIWALNIIANSEVFEKKEQATLLAARNADPTIRKKAFAALVDFGAEAIPFILELVNHKNKDIQQQAKAALHTIQKLQQQAILDEKKKIQAFIQKEHGQVQLHSTLTGDFKTKVGKTNTYTVTVENKGLGVAYNVYSFVSLPQNFKDHIIAGASAVARRYSRLEPNEKRTYTFTGMAIFAGEYNFTLSLRQNGKRKIKTKYSFIVAKGRLPKRVNSLPIKVSLDRPGQPKIGQTDTYKLSIENAGAPLKDLVVRIKPPFNATYKKRIANLRYEVAKLEKRKDYSLNLKTICHGEGHLAVLIFHKEKLLHAKRFSFNVAEKNASYQQLKATENKYKLHIQSSLSTIKAKVGEEFMCSVYVRNKSQEIAKGVTVEIYIPKHVNSTERSPERRDFRWVDMAIEPSDGRTSWIPFQGLSAGKAKVQIKCFVSGEEVYNHYHAIDIVK